MSTAPTSLRPFWALVAVRFCANLAAQMQAVVVGWQMYQLTHSTLALGLVGLAEAGPALSLALWAGHFVDTHAPRRVLRGVMITNVVTATALALTFILSREAHGHTQQMARVTALFVASLLAGASRAFWSPSIYALTPLMVPRAQLAKAAAWMGGVNQVAQASGPALGGLLMAYVSNIATLMTLALLLLAGLLVSLALGPSPKPAHVPKARREAGELTRGLRYVWTHQVLFGAMTLDMVSVLFGGVTALLPVFAEQVLLAGPSTLGLLRAAPAFGATLANLVLTRVDIRQHAGRWLLWAVFGFGCCILAFGLSRDVRLSFVILLLSGLCDGVSMVIRSLIIQLGSPAAMRGRISAVNSMFVGSANELGELESGLAASAIGLIPSVLSGGVVCLGTVAAMAIGMPALRRLNLHLPFEHEADAAASQSRG